MAFKLVERQKDASEKMPGSLSESSETAARIPLMIAKQGISKGAGIFGDIGEFTDILSAPGAPKYKETPFGKFVKPTKEIRSSLEGAFPVLKPKNKVEEFSQDLVGDALDLYGPGKILKAGKYSLGALRSFSIALAGNAGKELMEGFSGDKNKGNMTKHGIMLALSLFNPTKAKDVSSLLYKEADQFLRPGSIALTSNLNNKIQNLEQQVMQGRAYNQLAPSEKFVIDEIQKVHQSTQGGAAEVKTIQALKKSLNENLSKFVFDTPDKAAKSRTRKLASSVNGMLRESLEEYGRTNPQWWKHYSEADKAHGVIAQSEFLSRGLEKVFKNAPPWMKGIVGLAPAIGTATISPIAAVAGAVGYQSAKIAMRITKSPALAKHYLKIMRGAATGNFRMAAEGKEDLEKEVAKDQKGKYKLVTKKK